MYFTCGAVGGGGGGGSEWVGLGLIDHCPQIVHVIPWSLKINILFSKKGC